jgi:hypothetical protein
VIFLTCFVAMKALRSTNYNEDDIAELEQFGCIWVSNVKKYTVTDTVVDNNYHAIEKHFTSCFKYPELIGFSMISKYQPVDLMPHTYANEQAIRYMGTDITKEFHSWRTEEGMARATAMFVKIPSTDEPWLVWEMLNFPLKCVAEDGSECTKYYDVWGSTELFNNEQLVSLCSLWGERMKCFASPDRSRLTVRMKLLNFLSHE